MKKLFLSLILATVVFSANAQINFIPKAGISIASVNTNPVSNDIQYTTGFQVGAALEFEVNDMFAIQPELLFIQKGYKLGGSGITLVNTLNYIEIPLLAKIKFGTEELLFHVNAGPSLGILVSGAEKVTGGKTYNLTIGSKETDDIKRTDFGLQFGGGLTFSNIVLDLRYGLGLSSTSNEPSGSNDTVKNKAISITVGYSIPIGGR